jgi:hypothetical protein
LDPYSLPSNLWCDYHWTCTACHPISGAIILLVHWCGQKTIYVPFVNVHDDVVKNESKAYVVA